MKQLHLLITYKNTSLYKEALEENIREKNNYYLLESKLFNFWLSNYSTFINNNFIRNLLKNTNFFNKIKNNLNSKFFNNNFTVIYSLDSKFLEWLSLRIGYCEHKKVIYNDNKIIVSNNYISKDYITSPQGLLLSIDIDIFNNKFNLISN
jgi:hypothetical protein